MRVIRTGSLNNTRAYEVQVQPNVQSPTRPEEQTPAQLRAPLSKDDMNEVRSRIFRHDDGIGVGPAMVALQSKGVLSLLKDKGKATVGEIIAHVGHANRGYLHVALRLLASQGWATRTGEPATDALSFALTAKGLIALEYVPAYAKVIAFFPTAINMGEFFFGKVTAASPVKYRDLVEQAKREWDLPEESDPARKAVRDQVRYHLDGLLSGPTMIALKTCELLDRFTPEAASYDLSKMQKNMAHLDAAFELFAHMGWVEKQEQHVTVTPKGLFAFNSSRAWAYGVPVSYLPMLAQLDTLLFGKDPSEVFGRDSAGHETHVHRVMNVKASGAAHTSYFKKIDEIVLEIFKRPIDEQPKFICDMGSGDGTLLKHLYEVVLAKTPRGELIAKDPQKYGLLMIGADYNTDAQETTRKTLAQAGIPHEVVFGDINDPDNLEVELKKHHIHIEQGLHVRSFLDHNRPYTGVSDAAAAVRRTSKSDGAFSWKGRAVPNNELEQNLVEHFQRWAKYVSRHGLLLLELHTIPARAAAQLIGQTLATGYDATHGFSDQFTIEASVFLACAAEAGLEADARYSARFPATENPTVTINFFRAPSR